MVLSTHRQRPLLPQQKVQEQEQEYNTRPPKKRSFVLLLAFNP